MQKQLEERNSKGINTPTPKPINKPTQKISQPTTQPAIQPSKKKLTNREIIAKVKPAVVYIVTPKGSGSGMIIDIGGHILTNAHVVSGVSNAEIKLSDTRSFTASVLGRDEQVDLAILKIEGVNFTFVKFGDSDAIEQGDEVFTLGYPFGLEGDVSFKEGTISRRLVEGGFSYLETSAEIHPGNSGGPLVNIYGEVVGINTATLGRSIGGVNLGETIKLAIPTNFANGVIPSLKSGRVVLVPKQNNVSETENSCLALKKESDSFALSSKEIENLTTEIYNEFLDDGLAENPAKDRDLDYPYNKTLAKRDSFNRRIDQVDTKVRELESTLQVGNILYNSKQAFNKGAYTFREAFDLKLTGYRYMNKDAYVYFNGSTFIPRSEIDRAEATLTDSIHKGRDSALLFLDGNTGLKKIQSQYKDTLAKAGCL